MAFSNGTVWEASAAGSDTLCSGGFVPTNSNFATDGAATNANTSSPVFTTASYNFVSGDVGAWVFIKSGTNSVPGWYKITSVAANAATLNAAIGAGVLYGGILTATNRALNFIPNTVTGIATTASPTSLTWGIDYSQQNSAKIAFTDMVIVFITFYIIVRNTMHII